jgi:lipopolysaccharide biosynthesis regulator YciM
MGGLVSGQLDKAIERLLIVAKHQPDNAEILLMLADTYEQKGDKPNAIKWYEASKKHISDVNVNSEIDKRITQLKK